MVDMAGTLSLYARLRLVRAAVLHPVWFIQKYDLIMAVARWWDTGAAQERGR